MPPATFYTLSVINYIMIGVIASLSAYFFSIGDIPTGIGEAAIALLLIWLLWYNVRKQNRYMRRGH